MLKPVQSLFVCFLHYDGKIKTVLKKMTNAEMIQKWHFTVLIAVFLLFSINFHYEIDQ
jgi:hypothetical protein